MKSVLLIIALWFAVALPAQNKFFPEHLQKTQIAKLQSSDSLVYYQCHVDEASQELTTSSGQKIRSKKRKLTITEKFVILKKDSVYTCRYYTSPFTNYPNKKFPYLTLKEVTNWNFEVQKEKALSTQEVQLVAALETKTHAIVHYELNINKSCSNEVIICSKKDKEQFIVEGDYLLSKLLNCNLPD
jgi:hypothetical protein